jgi:hypothetical protein
MPIEHGAAKMRFNTFCVALAPASVYKASTLSIRRSLRHLGEFINEIPRRLAPRSAWHSYRRLVSVLSPLRQGALREGLRHGYQSHVMPVIFAQRTTRGVP